MSYKLNRAPKAIAALLAAAALFGGLRYSVTHGLLSAPTLVSRSGARRAAGRARAGKRPDRR